MSERLLAAGAITLAVSLAWKIFQKIQSSEKRPVSEKALESTVEVKSIQAPSTYQVTDLEPHIGHLLNSNYHLLDPGMPSFLQLVADLGANQCWHKHGTFGEHLLGVWKILNAWKQPREICRMGLFHSTYSNSWVGLALLKPNADRAFLKSIIGEEAEQLVHVMCSVPRMELTFRQLAKLSEIPKEGIVTQDIRTKGDLPLSRRLIAIYLIFHVADWAEQFSSWQDRLFRNEEKGDMETPFLEILDKTFQENPGTLWPGDGRPGLYLNFLSRCCQLIRKCEIEDLIPPVFENCTQLLTAENEKKARDLYWRVITELTDPPQGDEAIQTLRQAVIYNPFVGEPHVLLAQCYIRNGLFEEAEKSAREALRLLYAWGVNWDKRVVWGGWVAWARVMLRQAIKKEWPKTSMEVINLGLVFDKK